MGRHTFVENRYTTVDLDAFGGESVQRAGGIEPALVEDGHPPDQRVEDVPEQPRGARHRQGVDDSSAWPERRFGDGEVGNQVEGAAMGKDDTFWAGSRSTGIDDLRDVVRVRIVSAR